MENLKYTIEDSTIAELLGVQNFTTDEAAILELVKNAYDAKAKNLRIAFSNNSIVISDDGEGMTIADIREHWMHVGKSGKGYAVVDSEGHTRVLAGSMGIGRFALARLGRTIEIESKKLDSAPILWRTDWESSYLDSYCVEFEHGTRIKIFGLRTNWRHSRQKKLIKYLSRMYNDSIMTIVVHVDGDEDEIVKPYFPKAEVGINCKSNIVLDYKGNKLITKIISDEFSDEAVQFCKELDLHNHLRTFNMIDELKGIGLPELEEEELSCKLEEIGDFSANFYFNFVSTNLDKDKFLYKYTSTPNSVDEGIVLYRNAFSISSHEGKKDWLGLGKRSRKSPAAASHETGAWRVRENQLSGYVKIDKVANKVLRDMSNRQGLEENIHYLLFLEIILCGLKEFERYRQSIIRKINTKNKEPEETKRVLLNQIVKNPTSIKDFTDDDARQLAKEIEKLIDQKTQAQLETKSVEEHYKYDVRILNVLATNGLKVSLVAHEITNNRNDLKEIHSNIIESLKEYNMWDVLNSPENQTKVYRNVPYMLDKNFEISKKLIVYLNTMLSEIEKKQFDVKEQNIYELVEGIINKWKRDYGSLVFDIDIDRSIDFALSEDIIQVVLDNLILNSIQQNEKIPQLRINISITNQADLLLIKYRDRGKGLDKKYHDNPRRILEVHETTRANGHGLGMWIVNNSVIMSGGEIVEIDGNDGFYISMSIGGRNV